jgi:type II secretory pathway pseudopilin PulG
MKTLFEHLEPFNESPRRGITLLEVLVACGILIMGLASVAALLPAAASMMAEASRLDRAANLATNAVADLRFRGLLSAASFNDEVKTLVFGEMFPNDPFGKDPFRRQAVLPTPLDEQAYGTAWFGATVAPLAADAEIKKGMPAKATVVVFRRSDPESMPISLTLVSPGIYRLDPQPELESVRKRFLPACTWVAVVGDDGVRWLHVGNSWPTYTKSGQTRAQKEIERCFVSFSDPDAATDAAEGNALTVHAFTGVLRLEEHLISLE